MKITNPYYSSFILLLMVVCCGCCKTNTYLFLVKNFTNYTLTKVDIEGNNVTVAAMDTIGVPITIILDKYWVRTGMQISVQEYSDNLGAYQHNSGINSYVNDLSSTVNVLKITLAPNPVFPDNVFQYSLFKQ
jgi:hypothetical protein